jgi:hypothetical protein
MRWLLGIVIVAAIVVVAYIGSALYALSHLVAAVRAGDGAAIAAQTNFPRLSHSLSDQIVNAYLDRIGATRRVSAMERVLIGGYGATVADALVTKMLTPDILTQALQTGRLPGLDANAPVSELPPLPSLHDINILRLLGRLHLVNPVQIAIRTSKLSDPDNYAAVVLHREGLRWKLAGIDLPRAVRRNLAASLPAN